MFGATVTPQKTADCILLTLAAPNESGQWVGTATNYITVTSGTAVVQAAPYPAVARPMNGMVMELDITAAATVAGDTLDVFVQTSFDGGINWIDIQHFTQILGNGGNLKYVTKINNTSTQAEFSSATTLAAASNRPILGDLYRYKYTVVSSSAPSFTFGVWLRPM